MKFKFNKITYIIKTQNLIKSSVDGCIAVSTEQTYNNMNKAMFDFNKALFLPNHKSYYNDIDIKILDETRTIVPTGRLWDKISIIGKCELDVSKAFTRAFIDINEIPVFCQFDVWEHFNNTLDIDELHELTLYYVKIDFDIVPDQSIMTKINNMRSDRKFMKSDLFQQLVEEKIFMNSKKNLMFNKEYNLIYGKFLREFISKNNQNGIQTLYYKVPSFIHKVDYKSIVDELWNTTIDEHDDLEDTFIKKKVANINFGLLEKGWSTNQKSLLFRNLNEAVHYQSEYGGKLQRLSHFEETMNDEQSEYIENDEQSEYIETEKSSYYILNIQDKAELRNGYRYIKELLLQHHNFKVNSDFYRLINNDINVYSLKTDAFVIDECNIDKAKQLLEFSNTIGGWKVSKTEDIILPSVKYNIIQNKLIEIPIYKNERIDIADEYDTDKIIEVVKENNPMMIRGLYAGTGKSYICQKMVEKGHKVVFVCPTNKLLQAFEGEAMTLNKFFGINFADAKLEPFDHSGYDVVVFDEIYFSSLSTYWRIKQFTEENKNRKILIAIGDTKQLKPVQEVTNTQDYETFTDGIIDNIFEYNIMLKECKRLHTQGDKDRLKNIKDDILVNRLSVFEIIDKYFQYTTDISGSKNNIAYLNTTCKNVSNAIRKLENRRDEYEVGEFLICREYTKTQTSTFNVNFKYKIVHIGSDGIFTLKNVKTLILQSLPVKKVRENFIFASCCTCHSAQGTSIDDTISIFDYNHPLVRNYPEWLWTAITRCRDLNKVKFFKYNDNTNDDFNEQCIKSYFERKILNYKEQDKQAKRTIPKEGYVNAQWFWDNINNQCNFCGCGFHVDMKHGNITANMTAQRKNNELTHTLDNIIPYCKRCNCSCK